MLDDSELVPKLTYEYDKTAFVPCVPTALFISKSDLIEHLASKFVIFVEASNPSLGMLPADEVRHEAIHDAEAVTSARFYQSKRLEGYHGCCDPILIFDLSIESWDPEETVIDMVHSEEDTESLLQGRLTEMEYIERPRVAERVIGERRYLVPREFYESWYPKSTRSDH